MQSIQLVKGLLNTHSQLVVQQFFATYYESIICFKVKSSYLIKIAIDNEFSHFNSSRSIIRAYDPK